MIQEIIIASAAIIIGILCCYLSRKNFNKIMSGESVNPDDPNDMAGAFSVLSMAFSILILVGGIMLLGFILLTILSK